MPHNTLHRSIEQTHDVLATRLDVARYAQPTTDRPRDRFPAIDTFLASTSRHLAAAMDTFPAAVRRELHADRDTSDEFIEAARRLEMALARAKAKLYGEAHAIHVPWSEVWSAVHDRFEDLRRQEEHLVDLLVAGTSDEVSDHIAQSLYRAELRAPTRPHPYVPHRGMTGRVARRICLRVDRFWDATEGRMVPEPIRPHDRESDGKFTQYLLADPHLPED